MPIYYILKAQDLGGFRMDFGDWKYLFPPRPKKAIPKSLLTFYERKGWVAQVKLNGTCNMISVSPENAITAKSRHPEENNGNHSLWAPSAKTAAAFKTLPRKNGGWYVFVAELMHSKVKDGPRDTNYIHDIVVADGDYLVGWTFEQRQELLASLFPEIDASQSTIAYHVIDQNTWLARNHVAVDLVDLYTRVIPDPAYEGLVMKRPDAKLGICSRESANQDWQVKCRRPHKNYGF